MLISRWFSCKIVFYYAIHSIHCFDQQFWSLWNFCTFIMPPPVGWDIKRWWPSSVHLSVPCLILSREWKDTASRKLTERKHIALVTRDPIYKLKGQRLMSPGRLILRRKMRRIFRRGRPTNLKTWFRDGVRWPASPTCAVAGHVEVQRSR